MNKTDLVMVQNGTVTVNDTPVFRESMLIEDMSAFTVSRALVRAMAEKIQHSVMVVHSRANASVCVNGVEVFNDHCGVRSCNSVAENLASALKADLQHVCLAPG